MRTVLYECNQFVADVTERFLPHCNVS